MFKWIKENYTSLLVPVLGITIFSSMLYGASHWLDKDPMKGVKCNWGEYKTIISIAKDGLKANASKPCGDSKNVTIVVANIYQDYALVSLRPDMKNCITDHAWIILKKDNSQWKFITLGTAFDGLDIPEKLFEI